MKDSKTTIIKAIACIAVLILTIILMVTEFKLEKSMYNNGYCSCDGKWRLLNVADHNYHYVCDKCGNTISCKFSPNRLKED